MSTARSTPGVDPRVEFASAVRAGLARSPQKELPSIYLYDDIGSALFETITLLPEYGLTRADERLIRLHAAEMIEPLPRPLLVTELGSGSGKKTRWLLEAVARRHNVIYCPIDVSQSALERCKSELGGLQGVAVEGFEASYVDGLERATARRGPRETVLVLFLGSTVGNFEPHQAASFLTQIRRRLRIGDAVLLGTDLEKPPEQLMAAYDDPTGVTAAFNRNILARINRELHARVDLRRFRHEARYDRSRRRIEMHLVSSARQRLVIPGARFSCTMGEGETILTEYSHKFRLAEIGGMARRSGFRQLRQWVDRGWPFAESLWVAV